MADIVTPTPDTALLEELDQVALLGIERRVASRAAARLRELLEDKARLDADELRATVGAIDHTLSQLGLFMSESFEESLRSAREKLDAARAAREVKS